MSFRIFQLVGKANQAQLHSNKLGLEVLSIDQRLPKLSSLINILNLIEYETIDYLVPTFFMHDK